jgi:4'-phosphopantetheinyl transferase
MSAAPCRVWAFRNDRGLEATELALLDGAEKTQAARLKAKSDRDAFIKTRAALRSIVGRETGVPPKAISFRYSTWGKPSIDAPGQPAIDFSVSHTKGLSAIALAQGASVGVDVEPNRACPDRIRIAADVFGVEVAKQLLAVNADRQDVVFLRLWTAGEAFVKARGLGFAGINGRVPIALSAVGSDCVVLRDDVKDRWSLTLLELGDEFIGHVAVGTRAGEGAPDRSVELRMAAGFGSR